jgi:hypothetical protein
MANDSVDGSRVSTVWRLRQRAAHCRQLASTAFAEEIARELESIAHEYDDDADTLESHPRFFRLVSNV